MTCDEEEVLRVSMETSMGLVYQVGTKLRLSAGERSHRFTG